MSYEAAAAHLRENGNGSHLGYEEQTEAIMQDRIFPDTPFLNVWSIWVWFIIAALGNAAEGHSMIPDTFDSEVNLVRETRDGHVAHHVWASAELAEQLVCEGSPENLALAERIIAAVLNCQERDPSDAHYGNYYRTLEKRVVEDLNAVAFVQRYLLPMVIRHADRLTEATRQQLTESLRIGCDEIRRMDVAVTYTNVAAMHALSCCLGGEWLNDEALAQYGYEKLERLVTLTAENGTVYEFNSPIYVEVTIDSLHRLASLTRYVPARIQAQTMLTRLALTTMLRLEPQTGYLTGPHSRATYDTTICAGQPERDMFTDWVKSGVLPEWFLRTTPTQERPLQIKETAYAPWQIATTTFVSHSFTLGTATREISRQTNVLTAHYPIANADRPAVMGSRYLINDTWFGDPERAPDRSEKPRLTDAGKAFVVQDGPRAIAVFAPRTLEHPASLAPASQDKFRTAKLVILWAPRHHVESVFINMEPIQSFPADVPDGAVVTVGIGETWTAIRPLTRSDLGHGAPARIIETDNELALELYNYLGPEKVFWDLERNSRFFRGEPQCGVYVELAERSDYPDVTAFVHAVQSGILKDQSEPPTTAYRDFIPSERVWSIEYTRDNKTLGMAVDLIAWKQVRTWNAQGDLSNPMWESPMAKQNNRGHIEVNDAALACGESPAWLYADSAKQLWVAGYYGNAAAVRLTTPKGTLLIPSMGTGTIVWDNTTITLNALDISSPTVDNPDVKIVMP